MPRIKKEDEFYTMLKEFAALIVDAADEYNTIICDFPESMSSIPQMKVYESKADERVKAIMAKLYTSFHGRRGGLHVRRGSAPGPLQHL